VPKSFIGIVKAKPGRLLLGGVQRHYSSRMETRDMAEYWTDIVKGTNLHENVADSCILELERDPEIMECEIL
jgi:hypothetical protein